jgi:hypothetical protein
VAELIEDGELQRHVARVRRAYAGMAMWLRMRTVGVSVGAPDQ